MSVVADQVIVELEAKLGKYRQDIVGARTHFDAQMAGMTASAGKMETATTRAFGGLKAAAGAALAAISVEKITEIISRSLEYASSLGKVAQQLGVTTEALQVYRYAAVQVGLTHAEMDQGLQKLTLSAGLAAQGAKRQATAFNELGINVRDATGNVKATDQIFREVADSLSKIQDPAARAAIEFKLFGEAGQRLDPILSRGSGAIDELRDAAYRLGVVLSDNQIQNADETARKLADVKAVLEARIAGAVADNASAILSLANALTAVASAALHAFEALRLFNAQGKIRRGTLTSIIGAATGNPGMIASGANVAGEGKAEVQEIATERTWRAMQALYPGLKRPGQSGAKLPDLGSAPGLNPIAGGRHPKGGGGGGPDPAAEAERRLKEKLRDQYELDRQELDGQRDLTQAQSDLVLDFRERESLMTAIIDLEKQARDAEIDFNLAMIQADRTVSKAQKDQAAAEASKAKERNATLAGLRKERVYQDDEIKLREDQLHLSEAMANLHDELLQGELALAGTAKERREIEQKIIDAKYEELRLQLQAVRDDKDSSGQFLHGPDERQAADRRLGALGALKANELEASKRANEGPLDAYRRQLDTASKDMNGALESVAVDGLKSLEDQLTSTVGAVFKLGGAFGQVANQIIADLIRIAVQQSIIKPLAQLLGGGGGTGIFGKIASVASLFGGGPTPTGLLASGSSLSNMINSLPGRATGGPVSAGNAYLVGEHGPELFAPSTGGRIIPHGQALSGVNGRTASRSQAGTRIYQINVSADHSVTPAGFARGLASQILQEAAKMDARTGAGVLKAMPARLAGFQTDGL